MPRTIWYFRKRLIALKALITPDSIGLTEEQELQYKLDSLEYKFDTISTLYPFDQSIGQR